MILNPAVVVHHVYPISFTAVDPAGSSPAMVDLASGSLLCGFLLHHGLFHGLKCNGPALLVAGRYTSALTVWPPGTSTKVMRGLVHVRAMVGQLRCVPSV